MLCRSKAPAKCALIRRDRLLARHCTACDDIPGVGGPLRAPYFANIMRLRFARTIRPARKRMRGREGAARYLWNAGH